MLLVLQSAVVEDGQLAEQAKAQLLERLAQADKALVDGADEFLQLLSVASLTQRLVATAA